MSHMTTVGLRQMQRNLSAILKRVDQGEEVLVTRRKRVIARLVAPAPVLTGRPQWPDFVTRAKTVKLKGRSLADTIREERET
jgi:antitoxin (DNA-binding transcriptional repressor) of toxin-antitoxin stability system